MANFVFNVARGMIGYYATLPGTNDAFIAVPIELTGIEADDVLADYDNLSDLLAGASNEQTTMGRKTLTNITTTVDDTTNKRTVDADDIVWTAATGNETAGILICYDEDTTSGTDSNIIPLVKLDMSTVPSGVNITYQFNAEGFYRSTSTS